MAYSLLDQMTQSIGALVALSAGILVIGVAAVSILFVRRAQSSARGEEGEPGRGQWPPSIAALPPPSDPGTTQAAPGQAFFSREPADVGTTQAHQHGPPPGPESDRISVPTEQALVEQTAPDPARLRLLGLVLGLLSEQTRHGQPPQLGTAIARLADGDQEEARSRLSTLSLALMGEDQEDDDGEVQLGAFLTEVLEGELAHGLAFSSMPEFQQALNGVSPDLRRKLDTIVWSRNADAINMLGEEDVEALERVAVAMATALVIDTSYRTRVAGDEAPGAASGEEAEPAAGVGAGLVATDTDESDGIVADEAAEPMAEAADEPAVETCDEPAAEAGDQAAAETGDQPAAETGDAPTAETGDQATAETGDQATAETGDQATAETGDQATAETGNEPAAEAGDQPVAEIGDEPAAEIGDQARAEAGDEPAAEAGDQATAEPGDQPAAEDAAEPMAEAGGDQEKESGHEPVDAGEQSPEHGAGQHAEGAAEHTTDAAPEAGAGQPPENTAGHPAEGAEHSAGTGAEHRDEPARHQEAAGDQPEPAVPEATGDGDGGAPRDQAAGEGDVAHEEQPAGRPKPE
jgi:hypothetical protein